MKYLLLAALITFAAGQTEPQSYQPEIPPAEPTPAPWWTGGYIQAQLKTDCPPWWTGGPAPSCQKDSVNLAVRFMRPDNRCREGGVCPGGDEYASCVAYNKKRWYPDYGQSGVCITAQPQGNGKQNLAYVEKVITVNPGRDQIYLDALIWAQTDAPARLMCDSFCKKCDKATEYCPDDDTTPIATGDFGNCDCFCRSGSEAADFDRCTTVSEAVCTRDAYCGGHGSAVFTQTGPAPGQGTCECTCDCDYYGRNCELKKGDQCDINDCHHHSYEASGTRPNCQCSCGEGQFNFHADPTCQDWTWNSRAGTFESTSTNFTNQKQSEGRCWGGCKPPGEEGEECRCTGPTGNWCKRFYKGKNGCVGDTNIWQGPTQYKVNSEGLQCVVEDDGKARCRLIPEDSPGPDEYTSDCSTNEGSTEHKGDSHNHLYWLFVIPAVLLLVFCVYKGLQISGKANLVPFSAQNDDKAINLLIE